MIIRVDEQLCASSGQCVATSAELFAQRVDDGVVQLLRDRPPAEFEDAAREAALMCPTQAITIDEDAD